MKLLLSLLLLIPSALPGQTIQNTAISFQADRVSNKLVITDSRTTRVWTADLGHCINDAVVTKWGPIDQAKFAAFTITDVVRLDEKMKVFVQDSLSGKIYSMLVALDGPSVSIEVLTENMDAPFTALGLPPMFTTVAEEGYLILTDRSSGVLKKQDDTGLGYNENMMIVYGSTNCLNLPLVGWFDRERGDAMMLQIESPLDANVHLSRKAGLVWPEPVWQCSMGKFAYPRRAIYRFIENGGYVKLAEEYRKYQKERGMLKTLKEKAMERPMVNRMNGAPPLWGEPVSLDFIKKWRNFGINRAIISNTVASQVPELNKLGYITLNYDSYGDIIEGPVWFQSDNIQGNGLMLNTGEIMTGWSVTDANGNVTKQFYLRSSSKYLNAAMAYGPGSISDATRNGNFIDVIMAGGLMEDYHPNHTFDRKADLKYKRDTFQYYQQKGLVIGTEHGNDWGVDLVDYTEGGLSGSNWWVPGANSSGWNAGQLRVPVSRNDFSPEFLKYGSPTQRIPFWQLVYSDCVATTWYWGESAGWFYKVAPEIKTMKDRVTLLYGDMPLFWTDAKFDWANDSAQHLETYYLTVPSMRDKFGIRMTSHEFLTDDRQVQRTTFANGSETVVNFGDTVFVYKGEQLPRNGFYVDGANFQQRCVLRNGIVVTWVKSDEFFYCDSPSPIEGLPLSISGKIVLFKMDATQWNLILTGASGESVEMSAAAISSFIGKPNYRVSGFDEAWNRVEAWPKVAGVFLGNFQEEPIGRDPAVKERGGVVFGKKVYALTD